MMQAPSCDVLYITTSEDIFSTKKSSFYYKRPGEISPTNIFNPKYKKNKSYYMNFKHKITVICLYNLYNKFKVHVV